MKKILEWEDIWVGGKAHVLIDDVMWECTIVDKWVTDRPLELHIGVEIMDGAFRGGRHSCRGNGKEGHCAYVKAHQIHGETGQED